MLWAASFETRKSRQQLKREIKKNWDMWGLCVSSDGDFIAENYNAVFYSMTPQEISKANIAVDIVRAEIKKQTKGRG